MLFLFNNCLRNFNFILFNPLNFFYNFFHSFLFNRWSYDLLNGFLLCWLCNINFNLFCWHLNGLFKLFYIKLFILPRYHCLIFLSYIRPRLKLFFLWHLSSVIIICCRDYRHSHCSLFLLSGLFCILWLFFWQTAFL